eukprot:COSAG01_NODE_2555_length_7461_cov_2.868514_11_plen_68_part_00
MPAGVGAMRAMICVQVRREFLAHDGIARLGACLVRWSGEQPVLLGNVCKVLLHVAADPLTRSEAVQY